MVHELGNPLTAAKLLVEGLRAAPACAGADASELLEQLRRLIERMDKTLAMIRSFARHSSGGLDELQPVELGKILRENVALVALARRNRRPRILLRASEPVWVRGDDLRLSQVFVNLLNNAVDAGPEAAEVEVMLGHQTGWAVVQVRDRGAGITARVWERMQQPFVTTAWLGYGHHPKVIFGLVAWTIVWAGVMGIPARRLLGPQQGLVAALAVDGVLKVAVFVVLGGWWLWTTWDGIGAFFTWARDSGAGMIAARQTTEQGDWVGFVAMSVLSFLLPRQFFLLITQAPRPEAMPAALRTYALGMAMVVLPVPVVYWVGLQGGVGRSSQRVPGADGYLYGAAGAFDGIVDHRGGGRVHVVGECVGLDGHAGTAFVAARAAADGL